MTATTKTLCPKCSKENTGVLPEYKHLEPVAAELLSNFNRNFGRAAATLCTCCETVDAVERMGAPAEDAEKVAFEGVTDYLKVAMRRASKGYDMTTILTLDRDGASTEYEVGVFFDDGRVNCVDIIGACIAVAETPPGRLRWGIAPLAKLQAVKVDDAIRETIEAKYAEWCRDESEAAAEIAWEARNS